MNIFGDSADGRLRLYQTADVVLLLINNEMTDAAGVCLSSLHEPEGLQKEYPFGVFVATYSKILLLHFKINYEKLASSQPKIVALVIVV